MTDRTDPADQPQGTEPDEARNPTPSSSTPSSAWPVWGATSSPRQSDPPPAAPEPGEAPAAVEPDEASATDEAEQVPDDVPSDVVDPDDAPPADASDEPAAVDASDEAPALDEPDEAPADDSDDAPAVDGPDDAPADESDEAAAVAASAEAPAVDASDEAPAADEADVDPAVVASDEVPAADEPDETPADGSDEAPVADASDEGPAADEPDETPADGSDEASAADDARVADQAAQTPAAASTDDDEPGERPVVDGPVETRDDDRADEAPDDSTAADPDGAVTRQVPVAAAAAPADAATRVVTPDGGSPDQVGSREEASDETRSLPTVAAAARAQAVSVHKPGTTRDDATAVLPPVTEPGTDPGAGATDGTPGTAPVSGAASAAPNAPVRTSALPRRTPSPRVAAAPQSPTQQSPSPQSPTQQSPSPQSPTQRSPSPQSPSQQSPSPQSPTQQSPAPQTPQHPQSVGSAAAPSAAPTTRAPGAPVPPALAGSSKVTAGPVPQERRESPLDTFEEEPHERRWPRRVLIGAVALVVLGGAYVGASYATADRVPRGTTVAGVDIGGLTEAEAVERLEQELASTLDSPIDVVAQEVQATIDPAEAGLGFDAQATVEGLTGVDLADPSRLWRQVAGVAEREPVTTVDDAALDRAIESLETSLSQAPVDGAIVFADGSVQATDATEGWAVDAEGAAEAIADSWLVAAQPIELPTTTVEPAITQAETDAALNDVAEPLVDAPISVTVEGELAVLQPADVAAAASMQPEDGTLVLHLDGEALAEDVVSQLPDGTLKKAADAHFGFKNDKPVLVPGRVGTTVDPEALATALEAASTAQDRTAAVEVTKTDPKNTTEAMKKLGVKEVVSEFSTPLTSEPRRTINIAQGLENITGVLVRPGETFSLTDELGPLDAAHGFVQAGAIVNGEHTDAWGGGLSQVSTTTFNAAYFAGMEDVEHTPHSEWFSRYPEGREATIFTGVIDMKWKNTTPYGALVQGWVADGRAYVRIWSTKYFTVESTTSGRSGVVQPTTVYSDSSTCAPQSAGNPGFTVTVTREVFLKGDLQETTSRTWRYRPQNAVVCGEPPSSDDEDEADEG